MKRLTKGLPPLNLFKVVSKRRGKSSQRFSSYWEALAACGSHGYQEDELVRVVVEKTLIFRRHLASRVLGLDSLRTMIGVGALRALPVLRVLDFGGAGGFHYSVVRVALGQSPVIRWNVVETGTMAKAAGEKLALDGLKFFDNIEEAVIDLGHVDLAFTSGALQYTPDPLKFLSTLVDVRADHLFMTRTALSDDDPRVTIQTSLLSNNGPGLLPAGFNDRQIKYPVTFASRAQAQRLLERSYDIRFSVTEDESAYRVHDKSFNMYGYFCDLRTQ